MNKQVIEDKDDAIYICEGCGCEFNSYLDEFEEPEHELCWSCKFDRDNDWTGSNLMGG